MMLKYIATNTQVMKHF